MLSTQPKHWTLSRMSSWTHIQSGAKSTGCWRRQLLIHPSNLNLNSSLRTVHMCVCVCVYLSYTTQHRTVLIIFPLIFRTIMIAQMMSTGRRGVQLLIEMH